MARPRNGAAPRRRRLKRLRINLRSCMVRPRNGLKRSTLNSPTPSSSLPRLSRPSVGMHLRLSKASPRTLAPLGAAPPLRRPAQALRTRTRRWPWQRRPQMPQWWLRRARRRPPSPRSMNSSAWMSSSSFLRNRWMFRALLPRTWTLRALLRRRARTLVAPLALRLMLLVLQRCSLHRRPKCAGGSPKGPWRSCEGPRSFSMVLLHVAQPLT
mmetsp:Transcript_24643/g.68719  ORF Transcript_24643/g.68719 Transcript_24643/m.68719 type:complete len:212 (+) Transcript_24643:791-1426(+)